MCSVPGISSYFPGSVVTYSNENKIKLLGVKPETLTSYGAVSPQCAAEMAYGVAKLINADYAVSITGIAGPDGGSPDKPVGTVWFALFAIDRVVRLKKGCYAGRTRDKVRICSVRTALKLLLNELKEPR